MNDDLATGLYEKELKAGFHSGTYADLNLYYLSDLHSSSDVGLIGTCRFPELLDDTEDAKDDFLKLDGCMLDIGTFVGGSFEDYNSGHTTTHEIGHWLGLFHVFHGFSCSGDGDFINDTPAQKTFSTSCSAIKDSCPNEEGLDSVHNYMDYSIDRW